jgi:hypothetical protein
VLIAEICGVSPLVSGPVIQEFTIPNSLPGSYNLIPYDHGIAIVDRPTPSWYLRPILRAMRQRPQGGTITVCGQLQGVPDDDLVEVGRMVGRGADAIVLHSEAVAPERIKLLRAGIDLAERALVVVHTKSERTAITRGLTMMRPGDGLLVLADNPVTSLRQLQRASGPMLDLEGI